MACVRGDAEAFDRLEAIAGANDLYAHAWSEDGAVFQLVSIRARVPRVADVVRALRRIRSAA